MSVPNSISMKTLGCRVLTFVHLINFLIDAIVQAEFRTSDQFLACFSSSIFQGFPWK